MLKKIEGNEFVFEMNKLGYDIDVDENPYTDYFALILRMAYKLDHAEKEIVRLSSNSNHGK